MNPAVGRACVGGRQLTARATEALTDFRRGEKILHGLGALLELPGPWVAAIRYDRRAPSVNASLLVAKD